MTKLVNHIGFIVRDNIPISIPYWRASDAPDYEDGDDEAPEVWGDVVADTDKDIIWEQVTEHFTFPDEANLGNIRYWVMQKAAIAFQSYKKRLVTEYIKTGLTPDFTKKGLAKLRDH